MKPEEFIGPKVFYDDHGQMIFSDRGEEKGVQLLLDVRGWGAIQNLPIKNPDKFQAAMGEWIVEAINEKLQRDGDD